MEFGYHAANKGNELICQFANETTRQFANAASRQDFLKKYYPKFTEGGDFIKNPQGLALQGGFPAYSFVFKIKNRKT